MSGDPINFNEKEKNVDVEIHLATLGIKLLMLVLLSAADASPPSTDAPSILRLQRHLFRFKLSSTVH